MEMCDALMIGGAQHWGGGDDIFGIGIAYGLQGSELSLESGVAVDKPCHLNVNTLVGTGADKIYFSGTELPYCYRVAEMNEMMIDDILHNLLNVSLTFASRDIIAQADIAEVGLAGGFEQLLAMNVITAYNSGEEGILEERHVVEDNIGGDIHPLRLHVFGYVAGGVELARSVGNEADEVMEEGDVADAVAFYHILQHNGIVDAGEIFPHPFLIVDANGSKTGKTAVVEVFPQRIIVVCKLMELHELHIGETLHQNLFVSTSEQCAQFTGQHLGVAARDEEIHIVFGTIASDRLFPALNVLHLVDEDIVMFVGKKTCIDVRVKFIAVAYEAERAFLLIYIYNVGIGFMLVSGDEVLHDITLTHSSLTDEYDYLSAA